VNPDIHFQCPHCGDRVAHARLTVAPAFGPGDTHDPTPDDWYVTMEDVPCPSCGAQVALTCKTYVSDQRQEVSSALAPTQRSST